MRKITQELLTQLIPTASDLRDITEWPQEALEYMRDHPYRRCGCCENEPIPGQHVVQGTAGFFGFLFITTRPCKCCNETGLIQYVCMN